MVFLASRSRVFLLTIGCFRTIDLESAYLVIVKTIYSSELENASTKILQPSVLNPSSTRAFSKYQEKSLDYQLFLKK